MTNKQPDPIDVHVGERVRARRKMLGFSQTQLGNNLGVTFQQVQKYERGTNRIGSSRLFRTSVVLQVPVSYFFEGVHSQMQEIGGTGEERQRRESDADEMHSAFVRISDGFVRRSLIAHALACAGCSS